MKSIRDCGRLERLERALLIIDGLCLEEMDTDTKLIAQIYKVAHVALGKCENPHEYWLDEIDQLQETLKEANIVDCDQHFETTASCNQDVGDGQSNFY